MKIIGRILKILTALAAIAGIVYVIATYGDKIVAWVKNLIEKVYGYFGCCDCSECTCECEDDCDACPCENDCDTCNCGCAAEEEAEAAAEEGTIVAEETDFEG